MYTEKEVFDLMCQAFDCGFKKYAVVDAGLEGQETEIEVAWILQKYSVSKMEDGKNTEVL